MRENIESVIGAGNVESVELLVTSGEAVVRFNSDVEDYEVLALKAAVPITHMDVSDGESTFQASSIELNELEVTSDSSDDSDDDHTVLIAAAAAGGVVLVGLLVVVASGRCKKELKLESLSVSFF